MKFKFVKHSQINEDDLNEIVSLKRIHWNYSIEEHTEWILNNINGDDIHVLMLDNGILVGYLNLVNIDVIINNINYLFLGIGNVCSREKGKGYGNKLVIEVDRFLVNNNQSGMLFCKDGLINFYKKFQWELIDFFLIDQSKFNNVNIMIYNFEVVIGSFYYEGRNF